MKNIWQNIRVKKLIEITLKISWIFAISAILVTSLTEYHHPIDSTLKYEVSLNCIILMSLLSAPGGPITAMIVYTITIYFLSLMGINYMIYMPYLEFIIFFVCCGIVGYAQWFIAVPSLWRKARYMMTKRTIL